MKRSVLIACSMASIALAGCAPGQTPPTQGQLFCQLQTAGGGSIIVGLIDAEATALAPAAAPVAILATDMGKAYVDNACALAAANQGGSAGTPVSPPPAPVGNVAVTVPAKVA